jgi:hypothetical protein
MKSFSEEFCCGNAVLRVDVVGDGVGGHVLDDMTFMNYRLAAVVLRTDALTRPRADLIWDKGKKPKGIAYSDEQLLVDGDWSQGELNKIVVSMLSLQMEKAGLHPFHSSAVRYKDRTILFIGGEANHGKSMSQIEGCRRGGLVVSTETTVCDERGWAVMGSKSVYLRQRAKGTERADIPNQDEGVSKFFDKDPEYIPYDTPSNIDLVVLPWIDGHFDLKVVEMMQFEREYQTFHSLMNYIGLHNLLSDNGIVMPILDTDALRRARGGFCSRFARARPYLMVRAKTPQILFDAMEERMQWSK